jgi:hypothetical protein
MGLIGDLTGAGALFDFAGKVIDKIFPDKDAADRAKLELFKLQQAGEMKQLENDFNLALNQQEVNKAEASHASMFVAGWRPGVGWTCCLALFYNYIGQPLFTWGINAYMAYYPTATKFMQPPALETGELFTLLFGMLGVGAMRSFDKLKGTAT